jgi:hypothetical protein
VLITAVGKTGKEFQLPRFKEMNSEKNRNARRDRKSDKRKHGMRVDTSARKLAEILRNRQQQEKSDV